MRKTSSIFICILLSVIFMTGCGSTSVKESKSKTEVLFNAIKNSDLESARKIIEENPNDEFVDSNGNTPLMAILSNTDFDYDKIKSIDYFLNKVNKTNVNRKNKDGETPIILTMKKFPNFSYKHEIIEKLIKNGADINARDKDGNTLLMLIINKNNFDLDIIGKMLIDKGIDINAKNNKGQTALMVSASYGGYCDLLIDRGADKNIKDNEGNTYQQISNRWSAEWEAKNSHVDVPKKEPTIGMTSSEALNSTWGFPKDTNKTTTKYGTREQWVYDSDKYIYLEDGIVTAIQE